MTQTLERLDPPIEPRARRRRPVWIAAGVATVAVGVLAGLGLSSGDYPKLAHSLYPYSSVYGNTVRADRPYYLDSGVSVESAAGHRKLDIRSVRPLIAVNSAGARLRLLYCVPPTDRVGGFSLGTTTTRGQCAPARAFRPGVVDLGFQATELIVEATATHAGVLRIDGFDVRYRDGSTRGAQHAGLQLVLRFTAHPPQS